MGSAQQGNGSEDDDDFYLASSPSGARDPDSGPDASRPLDFYTATSPEATLRLAKDGAGRVVVFH